MQALLKVSADMGVRLTKITRWLGVDYAPGVAKARAVRRQRVRKVAGTWRKALAWRGKGIKVANITKQGIVPSMQYWAACYGSTTEILKACWATVSTSVGAGPGRSAILVVALQGAEDYAKVVLAPVKRLGAGPSAGRRWIWPGLCGE